MNPKRGRPRMKKGNPNEATCTFDYEPSIRTRLEALAKASGVDLKLAQMMRLAAAFLADNAEARGLHEIMREVAAGRLRQSLRLCVTLPADIKREDLEAIQEAIRRTGKEKSLGELEVLVQPGEGSGTKEGPGLAPNVGPPGKKPRKSQ